MNLLAVVLDNTQTERKLPIRPRIMTPMVMMVITASQSPATSSSVTGHP